LRIWWDRYATVSPVAARRGAAHAGLGQLVILNGEPDHAADRGGQAKLFVGIGVPRHGTVEMHHPLHAFVAHDRDAEHALERELLEAGGHLVGTETLVRVGAQHALALVDDVTDHAARHGDPLLLAALALGPVAHRDRLELAVRFLAHQHKHSIHRYVADDDFGDVIEQVVDRTDRPDGLGQFVHQVPGVDRVGGFGRGQDHALVAGLDGGQDGRINRAVAGSHVDDLGRRGGAIVTGHAPPILENHDGAADLDLHVVLERAGTIHPFAVHVGSVGAAQIGDFPSAAMLAQLGVTAGHGVVAQVDALRPASDQRRIGRQLEDVPLVGALQDLQFGYGTHDSAPRCANPGAGSLQTLPVVSWLGAGVPTARAVSQSTRIAVPRCSPQPDPRADWRLSGRVFTPVRPGSHAAGNPPVRAKRAEMVPGLRNPVTGNRS
jgi:hypothetical protein